MPPAMTNAEPINSAISPRGFSVTAFDKAGPVSASKEADYRITAPGTESRECGPPTLDSRVKAL
jgi:hypothetical protein